MNPFKSGLSQKAEGVLVPQSAVTQFSLVLPWHQFFVSASNIVQNDNGVKCARSLLKPGLKVWGELSTATLPSKGRESIIYLGC